MEIVARLADLAQARALVVALRAYGFHPPEIDEGGLPGASDPFFSKGFPVRLPAEEVNAAQMLVNDLLRDLAKP